MNYPLGSYPKSNVVIAIIGVLCLTTVLAVSPSVDRTGRVDLPVTLAVAASEPALAAEPVPAAQAEHSPAMRAEPKWLTVRVRTGDSLATIFKAQGIPAAELQKILALGSQVEQLRKIAPGQDLRLDLAANGDLNQLQYRLTPLESLTIVRVGSQYAAEHRAFAPEIFTSLREGEINKQNSSLFLAGKAAGLSDGLIMELSYIFQWDISFALDMREGDHFSILYEEKFLQGQKIGEGNILAASFTNMGKTHQAVLYIAENGSKSYYTPSGENLRKAFLRDPIHFSRVSSNFNMKRLHPIQKRVMPHRGTDYAAPRGTPVKAAGDGVISIARQNAASGKYIVIQHGEQYQTKYLHLNGFAKGMRPGKRVQQGQVIGYVGSTGWATAPHLHYEFLVNGVHRNPRTVTLPDAEPVPSAERERFIAQTSSYLLHLESFAKLGSPGYSGE